MPGFWAALIASTAVVPAATTPATMTPAATTPAAAALPPMAEHGQIIVDGHVIDHKAIKHAIQSISRPESTGGLERQYPRWNRAVCVTVIGFPREDGQYIADEIGAVARGVGLKAGGPGCRPDIIIFATSDPADLVARMRRHHHELVSGREVSVLDHFQKSDDPVRWISAVDTLSDGATPAVSQGAPSGLVSPGRGAGQGGFGVPSMQAYDGGSLLKASTLTYLHRTTVVVDARRLGGIRYQQLADYLALTTLAQVRPGGDAAGVESILSLFAPGDHAPEGLTRFDKAYLAGIYKSDPQGTGLVQRGEIVHVVHQALRAPQDDSALAAHQPSP